MERSPERPALAAWPAGASTPLRALYARASEAAAAM
ncbi:MAG: hypothetical protein OSP8Acid_01470 [uncultured Acidilobus sp. OSP8]|nr:MAG: hypothetical protein OSP8Acid_01470 [uncultured Acidilobus sp. OSP8]